MPIEDDSKSVDTVEAFQGPARLLSALESLNESCADVLDYLGGTFKDGQFVYGWAVPSGKFLPMSEWLSDREHKRRFNAWRKELRLALGRYRWEAEPLRAALCNLRPVDELVDHLAGSSESAVEAYRVIVWLVFHELGDVACSVERKRQPSVRRSGDAPPEYRREIRRLRALALKEIAALSAARGYPPAAPPAASTHTTGQNSPVLRHTNHSTGQPAWNEIPTPGPGVEGEGTASGTSDGEPCGTIQGDTEAPSQSVLAPFQKGPEARKQKTADRNKLIEQLMSSGTQDPQAIYDAVKAEDERLLHVNKTGKTLIGLKSMMRHFHDRKKRPG
jgi:hypothetical protein